MTSSGTMAQQSQIRLDFVCVHNAGRSQMAAAFAERECAERGLEREVEIHSGGTDPADSVHDRVIQAMSEIEIDVADRSPRYVASLEQLKNTDHLVTMGCSISEFNPSRYGVESHAWDLTNPDGKDIETVREVRDEIGDRVTALFDEIETTVAENSTDKKVSDGIVSSIRNTLSF